MSPYILRPLDGAGRFKFGDPRDKISFVLGANAEVFRRTDESAGVTVACDSQGLHLEFDSADKLVSITVFRPFPATLGRVALTNEQTEQVVRELGDAGYTGVRVDAGWWYESLGLLLIDVDGIVDGVSLYSA